MVLVAISLLAVLTTLAAEPVEATHGGEHPTWNCDGTPILMRGGRFYLIVPDPAVPGNLTVQAIPGTSGIYNSTAYDPTNDYVYGVGRPGGIPTIRAYDANGGIVFQTAIQAPYPVTASQYAGTVLGDGRYIIHSVGNGSGTRGWYNGARYNLWSVDPLTGVSVHIAATPVNFADFSYNPLDGYLYQIVNRRLYKVDPNTGAITTSNLPGAFPNGGFGSSWFDAAGFLYSFRNNPGDIFKVDVNDPNVWSEVGEVGADGGTDGSSCVSQIDLKKDVVDAAGDPVVLSDRVYAPGDTVTYAFTVINNGLPTQGLTVTLCDVLPADGRSYSGTWSSTDPDATITSGGAAGDTDVCFEVDADSSLWTDPASPGATPVVVTVDVVLGPDMAPGEYENQATLDYDQDGVVDVLSDDPGDGSQPRDPTTIQVTGGFTVTKTVEGHPDGPTTDSFTVTIACTTVGGAALSVPASAIVNTATGSPWPDAGVNTFTITDGQSVSVRDLPAGATCTATETVPAAYAVTPTSSDGTVTAAGGSVVIDEPQADEIVTLTNATGSFRLRKITTSGSPLPLELDGAFEFRVVCDNGLDQVYSVTTSGGSVTATYPDLPLLPDGTSCSVTEQVPAGWSVTSTNPQNVAIAADTAPGISFTNERRLADLTISKAIIGLPGTADPTTFAFDVSVSCTGAFDPNPYVVPGVLQVRTNAPLVVPDLPVGAACTVTEAPVGGFVATYSPAQTVTIDEAGSSVQITNSTGSLIVQKNTEVSSGLPVDPVASFDFTIDCVDGDGDAVFSDTLSLVTDSLTPTGAVGGISFGDLPLLPAGAICTITELPAAGWTRTQPADTDQVVLAITADDPEPTAQFTNERDLADFSVTKVIAGAPPEFVLGAEPFTVDVTCTGGFAPDPYVTTETVTPNTPLVIAGVPTGATCSVVEAADARFITSYAPAAGDLVDDDGGAVEITNTTSTLSLTKIVTTSGALPVDTDASFDFAIVCTAPDATVLFDDTVTVTTSGDSGTAAAADLPLVAPGSTCVVTEQGPPAGWTITDRSGGTNVGADAVSAVTAAGTNPVEFTNERDVADLTITKDVVGLPVTPDVADDVFSLTVTCTGDFAGGTYSVPGPLTVSETAPLVVADLPVGAVCTVVETPDARFATTYDPQAAITIAAAGSSVEIINETTSFSITKTTSVAAGVAPDATFTFTVTCASPDGTPLFDGPASITTSGGTGTWESPDAPLLPAGSTCSIVEGATASWSPIGATTVDITTASDSIVDAAFVNERDVADLTITKTILGVEPPVNFDDEAFTVNITCVGEFASSPLVLIGETVTVNTPLVIPDLPTGAVCSIDEDFDSRFQTLYSPDIGDGSAARVTIGSAGATAGITNSGGQLAVRKDTTVTSAHPVDLFADFDYRIDCGAVLDDTYSLTVDALAGGQGVGGITYTELPVLPAGTVCTVTETVPAGWTLTTPNAVSITVGPDAVATASFVNDRDTGDLTITKVLDGVPAGIDLSAEAFTIDISCTGGFTVDPYVMADQTITAAAPLVIEDLPVGAVCSVVEDADPRFSTTISAPVTIDADGESVTVTNSTSAVAITKTTIGATTHPIDLDATFDFDIDCGDLVDLSVQVTTVAQSGVWDAPATALVPPGTGCDITETAAPAGWTNTGAATQTVTTDSAGVVTAAFVNERQTATLDITKTITGAPIDLSDEPFTVTVTCTGGFTTPTLVLGPFVVTENAPIAIPDLPVGTSCVADETVDPRFLPSYAPDDATAVLPVEGAEIGIENRTGTLTITKEVTVAGSQPIDMTADFVIDLVCTDGTDLTVTLSVVDGVAASTTYPELPLLPDGTACTATETVPAGWTLTTPNAVEVVIASGDDPTITFVNDRDTGDLSITKTVLGAPTGLDPDGLTFSIDITCVGDFDTSPLEFPNTPIDTSGAVVIPDLPTDAVCSVTEDPDTRFAATYTPDVGDGTAAQVVIDTDGEDVAIVNATGEVMIVKNTQVESPHPVDVTGDFDFLVDCGAAYSGTHTVSAGTVTSPTTATGFLRYSDIPALPNGASCTVTEQGPPAGWTVVEPGSVDLTVDSTGVAVATFTNTRSTGDLTVTKVLDGVPDGVDLDDVLFEVTVTCEGDFDASPYVVPGPLFVSVNTPLVVEDVPTGAVCSVVEAPDARFATSYSADVTIDADGGELVVTNATGSLSISKVTVFSSVHPVDEDATFTWQVTCTSPDDSVLFDEAVVLTTVDGVAAWAAPDAPLLPPGTSCEVTEQATTGWSVTSDNPQTVVIDSAGVLDTAFTNTRDTGDLTVTKVLEGVPDGVDFDDVLFEVTVTCAGDFDASPYVVPGPLYTSVNNPLVVPDLPTGADCTIAETIDPRFAATYPDTDQAIIDTDGETRSITNATGEIVVAKETVAPTTHPIDATGAFDFRVDCGAAFDEVVTVDVDLPTATGATGFLTYDDLPLLPNGTDCTVTEQDPGPQWILTSAPTVDLTVSSAAPQTASFTNERVVGPIEITKTLDGVPDGVDLDDELFEVTVTCTGGFTADPYVVPGPTFISANTPLAIADLPTGAVCSVVEAADARFTTSYAPADGAVTVDADGETVGVTNATGSLSISKATAFSSVHPVDEDATFTWQVTCTAPDDSVLFDEAVVLTTVDGVAGWAAPDAPLLPPGTSCEVTEQATTGWSVTSDNPQTVVIDSAGVLDATFTNTRDTGDLTVTKTLDGVPDDVDFDDVLFEVTVTCTGDFDASPYVVPGPLYTSVNNPLVVPDLPTGAGCTIAETPDGRFATTYTPDDGSGTAAAATIDTDGENVGILNATGSVIIAKETVAPTTHPIDATGTFSFLLDCGAVHSQVYDVDIDLPTTTGAVGFLTYAELPFLPNGTDCAVTEQDPGPQWTLTTAPTVDLTVDSAAPQTASFTNERVVGPIEITKTLDGVPAAVDLSDALFEVTVTCDGDFAPSPYVVPAPTFISANTPLTIADLPTDAACTVVEAADERFTTTYAPADGAVTVATDGETVGITNTTSTVALTKTTEISSAHPIDEDATFDWQVTCTAADETVLFDETVSLTTVDGTAAWIAPDTPLLPPGTACSVTEQPAAGWTVSDRSGGTLVGDASVDVVTDVGTNEVGFTNTRDTATLTIDKALEGVPDDIDLSGLAFDVTVTCTGFFAADPYVVPGPLRVSTVGDIVIDDLPTGTSCAVVETPDPRFAPVYEPADGAVLIADDPDPADGEAPGNRVSITNRTGTFVLVKATAADSSFPLDLTGTFTFAVTCDDDTNGTYTVDTDSIGPDGVYGSIDWADTGLHPAGTVCQITEIDVPDGWTLTSEPTVTVTLDPLPSSATFVNDRNVADLVVAKKIVGAPATAVLDDELFVIAVECTGDFIGGSFTLPGPVVTSVNDPLVVSGLPTGADCSVAEAEDGRFTAAYEPAPRAAVGDEGATVTVVNRTATLAITKNTEIDTTHPATPVGVFTFAVECTNGFSTTVEVDVDTAATSGGTAAVGYPTLPLLADGTTCVVTEADAGEHWARIGSAARSTVVTTDETGSAEPADVSFTNVRQTEDLVVTKSLSGVPTSFANESFEIEIRCGGDFASATGTGYVVPGPLRISAGQPVTVADLPTGSTCTVNELAATDFTASYAPAGGQVTIGEQNVVAVTNTYTGTLGDGLGQRPTSGGPLAFSGASTMAIVMVGLFLFALGGALLVTSRRRAGDTR